MELKALAKRYSLALGIALMFALTWPFYRRLGLFVGYGLALAALVMTGLTMGSAGLRTLLGRFLIWRVGVRWYLVALAGPAILVLAAIGLNRMMGGPPPDLDDVVARGIFGTSASLWYFVIPFFLLDAVTNGEELGWRGYVLPRLQARFSALVSSLILGTVWGLWHLPKFWAAGDTQSLVLAVFHNIAMAVLFTWISNSTRGSLLIATLGHAASNTAYVFLPTGSGAAAALMPRLILIGVELAAALVVVAVAGPARLSRRSLPQVQSNLTSETETVRS